MGTTTTTPSMGEFISVEPKMPDFLVKVNKSQDQIHTLCFDLAKMSLAYSLVTPLTDLRNCLEASKWHLAITST